ncbi:MAG: hypothetical protein WA323_27145 [Candidatus Nitrosopolaris sp.]
MSNETLLCNIVPFAGSGLLAPRISNGFCFEKDLEVDANHHRLLGWDVPCWYSTAAKVWLCERG